jgi:hypothetical protein
VLPTVTTVDTLEEFAAAASKPLSADEFTRVQELYGRDFDLPPEKADEQIELRTSVSG